MSTRLVDLPHLMEVVKEMCRCNGIETRQLPRVTLPDAWDRRALLANNSAADLDGRPLKNFVPENEIDIDLADPDDEALTIMADGEETMKDLLVAHTNARELDALLNALFEGELSSLLP